MIAAAGDQGIGTQYGETLYSPNATMATDAPAAVGADGASGPDLGGMMTGMGISSAISAAGQTITSLVNYFHQEAMLEKQQASQLSRYDHQDRMAKISKEMQLKSIETQQSRMHIVKEGQKQLHQAVEERKKAEDQLKIAEAREKEIELTKKTGKANKKTLDNIFKTYNYGNPVAGL